jgi:hypothetical protein
LIHTLLSSKNVFELCTALPVQREVGPQYHTVCPIDAQVPRLFFTTFSHPVPRAEVLNQKHVNSNLPIKPLNINRGLTPLESTLEKHPYYYFTFDDALVYNSFFMDWGPLNLAMVYKACIFIHELLQVSC